MSIPSTAVKKTAITTLKGNYLQGIITSAMYIFACLICVFCTEIAAPLLGVVFSAVFTLLLSVFLIIPLTLGLAYWGIRMIFCGDSNPLLLFYYFTGRVKFRRAINFAIPFTFKAVTSGVILFIPAFLADFIASGKLFTLFGAQIPLWISGLFGLSAVLKVLAFFSLIAVMLKYYMSPFLMAADEKMDPAKAMHISTVIATRSKKDFIWLIFSFTLYILACLFMIPTVFIMPYFTVSYAVHCRFAVAAYNKIADSLNSPDIPTFRADISF